MTSISTIPEQSGNEVPRPQLVISAADSDDGWIRKIAYLPDGRVVTGSKSGAVRVWNLQTGEREGTSIREHEDEVWDLAVTRDGARIISGDINGQVKVWDVKSHKLVKAWTHRKIFPVIAISPDDRLIAVGGWPVGIYTTEGEQVNSIEIHHTVIALSFSPDGNLNKLACGTKNDIRVYDINTGTPVLDPLKGHEDLVRSVLWSRDGSKLFSASHDKTIRCWNSGTGKQTGQPWTGHTDRISSLSLSPDGTLLASASWDKTVRFWDTAYGRPIRQHLQHDVSARSVCFSPSGEFVASGDEGGNIYQWRVSQLDSGECQVIIMTHIRPHHSRPLFSRPIDDPR